MIHDELALERMLKTSRGQSWQRRHVLGWPIRPVDIVAEQVTATDYTTAKARGGFVLVLVHDGQNFSLPRLARIRPNYNAGTIEAYLPDGTDFLVGRLDFATWFGDLVGADFNEDAQP